MSTVSRIRSNRIPVSNGHAEVRGGVRVRLETITPEIARRELDRSRAITQANPERKNRKCSEEFVMELAQAIENGEWEVNGETIKFAIDGFCEDGQHRLEAVCIADRPIETYVVRGLDTGCFDTIDRGKVRTMSQILHRHGEVNTNVLAAAISLLTRYETDSLRKPCGRQRPSKVLEMLAKHKGLRESVRLTSNCTSIMPQSIAATAHYLFSKLDGDAADLFFGQVVSGENITRTQAVYHLRERLLDNRTKKAKLRAVEIFALTCKAWNATRSGQRVKCLRWRTEGDAPEEFPKPE